MPHASCAAAAALAALCLSAPAVGRPFTIDDLVHQRTFGAQATDPTGRWAVIEQRDPYERAPRFDWYLHTGEALTRLKVVDFRAPGRARPLLKIDPGPGVTLAGFSPSGRRLAVYRLHGTQMSLGVVTMKTGRVRWWSVTPERPDWGRGLQWLSDTDLLVIAHPDHQLSWSYREGRAAAQREPGLWRASAAGELGASVVGSGVYSGVRPRPAPSDLLRIDTIGGRIHRVATGAFRDLEISPGGKRVALLETGPDIQPRANGPAQGLAGISDQEFKLSLLDLRTLARSQPCPGWDLAPHLLAWSPNGAKLLVFARPSKALWTDGRLLSIDPAVGTVMPVDEGLFPVLDLRPEVVHAGWMGEDPIALARPRATSGAGRPDWYRLTQSGPINLTHDLPLAPRELAALDAESFTAVGGGGIWRVTRTGGATRLASGAAYLAEAPRTTAGTQRLDLVAPVGSWVVTATDSERLLQWIGPTGLAPVIALPADAAPELLASRTEKSAIVLQTDAHGTIRLRLLKTDRPSQAIASVNNDFADIDPPRVRPVSHFGPDGQRLRSWLFTPGHPAAAPPPLIVQVYSGRTYAEAPQDYPGERGFLTHVQMLVGHGYAVLVASLPLPREHHDPIAGLGERIAGIVEAASANPDLAPTFDSARVALWGQSYGGYTVMAALSQTRRFRAGVSIAGLSDLISKWETMPAAYRASPDAGLHNAWSAGSVESGQDGMDTPPWIEPARYTRNSPLFAADRIVTPLLLIHGDQDVIPLAQSEAMFQALYRQDKDALLVTYWGEGHLITSPGNVRDLYRRSFAFLDEHFKNPQTPDAEARGRSRERDLASDVPRPRR